MHLFQLKFYNRKKLSGIQKKTTQRQVHHDLKKVMFHNGMGILEYSSFKYKSTKNFDSVKPVIGK